MTTDNKKILMPSEEWEDFRVRALGRSSNASEIRFFKMAFFGAMSCATDFFQNILSGDYPPEETHAFYVRWRTDLQAELDKYEGELARALLEDTDGSNN